MKLTFCIFVFCLIICSSLFADDVNKSVGFDIGPVFSSEPEWQNRTQLLSTFELELIDFPVLPFRVLIHPLFYQTGGGEKFFFFVGGLGSRFYFARLKKTGLFLDISSSICVNSPKFPSNGSSFNFYSQLGFGYSSKIVVALRLQHYSNANFSSQNLGWNALVLSIALKK